MVRSLRDSIVLRGAAVYQYAGESVFESEQMHRMACVFSWI